MDTPSLLSRTLALLAADPRSMRIIAEEAGVGQDWLKKLKAGEISDPGVTKIERLYRALSKVDVA